MHCLIKITGDAIHSRNVSYLSICDGEVRLLGSAETPLSLSNHFIERVVELRWDLEHFSGSQLEMLELVKQYGPRYKSGENTGILTHSYEIVGDEGGIYA